MKNCILSLAMGFSAVAWGASDTLASLTIKMNAPNPDAVIAKSVGQVRTLFRHYIPVFDNNTTIISPLKVSGSQLRPVLDLTAKKCEFLVCETVHLNAVVTIGEVSGKCRLNYAVAADLAQSSPILANEYNVLKIGVCYNSTGESSVLQLVGSAQRSPRYSGGVVASEILSMLRLQISPMSKALQYVLAANGGTVRGILAVVPELDLE